MANPETSTLPGPTASKAPQADRAGGLARRFCLRPVGSTDPGFEIQPGQTVTVGRDPLNLIQIGHGSIEGFHCRIRCDELGLFTEPLGGATVKIGGRLLKGPTRVPTGLQIQVGQVYLEAMTVEVESRSGFRQELWQDAIRIGRSIPWYTASIAFHLLLLTMMKQWIWMEEEPPRNVAINSDWVKADEPLLEDVVAPMETLPDDEPEELELPELDLDDPEPAGDPDVMDPVPLFPESDLSSVGVGLSGPTGHGLMGGMRLRLPGGSSNNRLVPYLRTVRGTGMDVVFVVDTTSSMRPFLTQAKRTVDQMVSQMVALVEDLHIGMVAFRDETDEYVTRSLDLSTDRYEILNFLESMEARGGGDIPEAVADGLDAASQMNWRKGTQRVIILIGDAPPHDQDWRSLRSTVSRFRGDRAAHRAFVSTVFTGDASGFGARGRQTAQAFGEIARLGDGDFLKLVDQQQVDDRLLLMTLGRDHEDDLKELLARLQSSSREVIIRKQFESKNVDWLLHKLTVLPVHPDVVNALRALADARVIARVRDILLDEGQPLAVRRAARYILIKELGPFAFDPAEPIKRQKRATQALRDLVRSY